MTNTAHNYNIPPKTLKIKRNFHESVVMCDVSGGGGSQLCRSGAVIPSVRGEDASNQQNQSCGNIIATTAALRCDYPETGFFYAKKAS